MSRPEMIPATGTSACFYCAAWRNWDTQAVRRAGGSAIESEPTGQCRALPPTTDRRAIGSVNADWPVVAASDWCLSFVPAQAAKTEVAA